MITQADINEICKDSTPAYIFDVDILKQKISFIRQTLGEYVDAKLYFAIKANPFLVKYLEELVDGFEVCSPGEFSICKSKGISPEGIVLSGVNKQEDIADAMEYGVDHYTIESLQQAVLLQKCARERNINIHVILRLTSGNQFGLSKTDLTGIIRNKAEYSNLDIEGIQYYSGTQKKSKKIAEEFVKLVDYCEETEKTEQFHFDLIEYGPGWMIDYFGKESDEAEMLRESGEAFAKASKNHRISLEMGRFMAADCGSYLTKAVDVKIHEDRKYCIVDGGINHVNYYGNVMGVRIPPVKFFRQQNGTYIESGLSADNKELCVCGSLCTAADVLIKSIPIDDIEVGDLFMFEKIGAYSVTEGIYLFLSRTMPAVYICENGKTEKIRDQKESYLLNM